MALEYFILDKAAFDAWDSPLKKRYPSPTISPDGSEVLMTLYQGPIALTKAQIAEIIALGSVRLTRGNLLKYQAAHPEKWVEVEL